MKRATILVLGPSRDAISGVATHVNGLFASPLATRFELVHFQVGSEGRSEGALAKLWRLLASPFMLAGEIARRAPAIVHLNTSLDRRAYWRDLAYLAVARLCGARVVYQVHGGELPHEFFRSRLLTRVLRTALGWPDAVVVLARCELESYQAFVPAQNVVLLPNGIDCAPYLAFPRPPAEPRSPLRLIFMGRLVATKGIYESLEGLRLARERGIAARLVVAGSGPEEERLRERVRELGLARDVSFAGAAYGERKLQLLAHADAMLLPTYHAEGLPYALLEAMAAGAVPVVTQVAALPDVVAEGVHGLFVPPHDPSAVAAAIARLDADRLALARMAAACRERVAADYSIARVASDFTALYSALIVTQAPGMAL
jgi:glycosyltransferase involved in cell wall biosynthesis